MSTVKANAGTTGNTDNHKPASDANGDGAKVAAKSKSGEIMGEQATIPVANIAVKAGWNARHTFDDGELRSLGESMRQIGQLASIVVARVAKPAPGMPHFWVVAGERRLRAARLVGLDKLRCVVIAEQDALRASWDENGQRSEISQPDRCRWLAAREDAGMTVADLVKLTGRSESAIRNDLGIFRKLAPEIWEQWSQHPSGHSRIVLRIYAKTHEEQRKAWAEYIGAIEKGKSANDANKSAEGDNDGNPKAPALDKPPTKRDMAECYAELGRMCAWAEGRNQTAASYIEGAMWALRYVAGQHNDPTDGMPDYAPALRSLREDMLRGERQQDLFAKPAAPAAAEPAPAAEPAKGSKARK